MTKKEIIATLKDIHDNNELPLTHEEKTAIDQAIKKVKKEQLLDALSLLKQLLITAAHIFNKK